jgi:hypothetical protein
MNKAANERYLNECLQILFTVTKYAHILILKLIPAKSKQSHPMFWELAVGALHLTLLLPGRSQSARPELSLHPPARRRCRLGYPVKTRLLEASRHPSSCPVASNSALSTCCLLKSSKWKPDGIHYQNIVLHTHMIISSSPPPPSSTTTIKTREQQKQLCRNRSSRPFFPWIQGLSSFHRHFGRLKFPQFLSIMSLLYRVFINCQ